MDSRAGCRLAFPCIWCCFGHAEAAEARGKVARSMVPDVVEVELNGEFHANLLLPHAACRTPIRTDYIPLMAVSAVSSLVFTSQFIGLAEFPFPSLFVLPILFELMLHGTIESSAVKLNDLICVNVNCKL